MKDFLKLVKVDFMQGVEEPWCNNQGVAILPYVLKDNEYYYLLTIENNPLFKNKQVSEYSTITGGLENNDPIKTVINEMKEETGINILDKRVNIHYLGWNYANKSSTKLWWFYGIDLTKLNLDLNANYKGSSDGSIGGTKIRAIFISESKLNESNDALSLATYGKLLLKNVIDKTENKTNQKLDKILQILHDMNEAKKPV